MIRRCTMGDGGREQERDEAHLLMPIRLQQESLATDAKSLKAGTKGA